MINTLLLAAALQAQPIPVWQALPAATRTMLQEEKLNEASYSKIAAGEIVTARRETPAGKTGVRVAAYALIHSTPELVFEAVADCPKMPEFMPHFDSCVVVPSDTPLPPNERWNENHLTFGFFPLKVKINITQHATLEKPSRLSWRRVKGDTKDNEGYWRIIPLAEGEQLLVYDTRSDPGSAVPEFIQRALTESDLPKTVEAVKNRVENTLAKR
jgi:uncharacterized membrane protein